MKRDSKMPAMAALGSSKRSDRIAEEIKRLITTKNLLPGDRLPPESELQTTFEVSSGTIREALKSLEVQGLIKIRTGPGGGAAVVEVPLVRTIQLMQNYLFFKEVRIEDIYQVRNLLEPELAASAVPHLTEAHLTALEHNIQCCDPVAETTDGILSQRKEEMDFHDIFAAACPNPFLRFSCEMINEMLRQLTEYENEMSPQAQARFGRANTRFHVDILAAARARDAERVHALMTEHMQHAMRSVTRLRGQIKGRLILDSELARSVLARDTRRPAAAKPRAKTVKAPRVKSPA